MPKIYNDARTDLFKDYVIINQQTKKKSISFENLEFNNSNRVLFQCKRQSFKYYVFDYNELQTIKHNNHLYEVITTKTPRKIFIDIDLKDSSTDKKIYISLNDISILCNEFIEFVKSNYNIQHDIKYIIQGSINEDTIYTNEDKIFCSFHIIFNIYTLTHTEQEQLLREFKKLNKLYSNYIDLLVYKNRSILRALNQGKEQLNNEPLRKDILKVLNINETHIITDYFITSIDKSRDILIQIIIKPIIKDIKQDFNIVYNFNQFNELKKYITNLKTEDLLNDNYNWKKNLNLIISLLYLQGIKWNEILNNDLMKLFLEISKIGQYNNEESYIKNINFIETIIKKQKIKKPYSNNFFIGLTNNELEFIYSKLNKTKTTKLYFNKLIINNKQFLNICDNETIKSTTHNLILYDIDKFTLLINADIYSHPTDKNRKVIKTVEQYNLHINNILNLEQYKFNTNSCIEFKNWNETIAEINNSCYYEAPVGSRKSSERMYKDIEAILKDSKNNVILMPCDNRGLSTQQKGKLKILFTNLNIEVSFLKNYLEYEKKPDQVITKTTRIFICCYDSIIKFKCIKYTHIIIDEYLNVRKRFLSINAKTNQIIIDNLKNFYEIINNCKAIKCYDADLQNLDLDIIQNYSNKKLSYYKFIDYIQVNNTIIITNYDRIEDNILSNIKSNKNFSISTNIKTTAEKLYDFILTNNQQYKVAIIISEGAKDNKIKKYCKDLKESLTTDTSKWENYNVIIYSPTIMTGISQDSNQYFYKHYGIFCTDSTDHTQTAQMLFRVRNTETHEIMICDINDRIETLRDYIIIKNNTIDIIENQITEQYRINNLLINEEIENVNDNDNILNLNDTNEINNTNNIIYNELYKEYKCIENNEIKQRNNYYYNLIYSLKKWGCNIIKFEYFEIKNETKFIIDRQNINYKNTNLLELGTYQSFVNIEISNEKINKNENDKEIKTKSIVIQKFGISPLLYNYNQYFDYYNYFIYNQLVNNNKEISIYKRIQKLIFYSIKNVIYYMLENVLKKVNIDTLYLNQSKQETAEKFIKWLLSSYLLFKLFVNVADYNVFINNIVKCELYNLELNEDFIKLYKESIKPIQPILKIFIDSKIIQNDSIETLLNFVCEYFYLEQDKIINNVFTFSRKGKIPYRIEKFNGILNRTITSNIDNEEEIEENEDYEINYMLSNLDNNRYDDIIHYINDTTKLYMFNKELLYNFTPKIRLYNTTKDKNEKLNKSFKNYFNPEEENTLKTLLKEETKILNANKQKIYTNEIINNCNVFIEKQNEIKNKYLRNINNIYKHEGDIILSEGEILKETKINNIQITNFGNVYYVKQNNEIFSYTKCKVRQHIFKIDIENNRTKQKFVYSLEPNINVNQLEYSYIYVNQDIVFIDRLVSECFMTNYRPDYFIKHIDGKYTNNTIENLDLVEKWTKQNYIGLLKVVKKEVKEVKKAITKEKRNETRNEKIQCEFCNKMYSYKNKTRHYKTHKPDLGQN